MRLKSINLAGFKSFVDPTKVSFKSNMTAIVGPNGCGKSNVIDAVRWVMGESSAKYLRGESMTDVIFNGSRNRKPVGQASIELVFDNSAGTLGGAYADYAEISVRRLVTRDAQSSYYMNGTKCRRRDITDLFLGTGLGPRSYAIIEQGMISRLIEARPEELRVYLEEAAGISKYKERRRETESRIKRTQENLERLNDIRTELGKQLERLGRQAEAAKYFQQLKASERRYKAEIAVLRWREADNQLKQLLERLANLELEQEACLVSVRHTEAQLETSRENQAQANLAYEEAHKNLAVTNLQIARLEQGLQHRLHREKQLQEELKQLGQQQQQAQTALQQDQEQLDLLKAQLEDNQPLLEDLTQRQLLEQEQLQLTEQQLAHAEQAWDELLNTSNSAQNSKTLAQARIQQHEASLQRLYERQASLENQLQVQSAEHLEQQVQQLQELEQEQELTQERLAAIELQEEDLRSHKLNWQEQQQQLRQQTNQLTSQHQQQQGRLASLLALQQAELAGKDAELESWLSEQNLHEWQRLGEVLQVEPGWEKAVEVSLKTTLAALLSPVPLDTHLSQQLGQLPSGELQVFQPAAAPCHIPAASLLAKIHNPQCLPASLAQQLARIQPVASLEQALALQQQLNDVASSLITPAGAQVFRDGLSLQAASNQQLGLLARQQEIQRLEASQELNSAQLQELEQQTLQCATQLETSEQQLQQLQHESRNVHNQLTNLASQQASSQTQLQHQQERQQQLQTELEQLLSERQQLVENLQTEQEQLQELLLEVASDTSLRTEQQQERDKLRQHKQQQQQQLQHTQQQVQETKLNQQLLLTKQQAAEQALARLVAQAQALTVKQTELTQELAALQEPGAEQSQELEDLLHQHAQQEQQVQALRSSQQQAQEEQRHLEQERSQQDKQLEQLRQQLEQQRLQQHSLMVKRDQHLEQLQELETSLHQVMQQLPPDAVESAWQTQLDTTQEKIRRLGAINLAAIDEHAQQAQRKEYLDAQNAELEDALNTLDAAIRRIDKETRIRFKETFEQVNTGLQNLFPRIFGGGSAWLQLTGDNLLETGVAIMARPPGKKNATIHLLSGGEKALTALALVFSIFELNPAPFCMLDEVDAPLDDANVGRYARLVQEMSSRIQFIYITHNKQAMESAAQLMGVTMQEPGVSRLVSVDLEEATSLVAS